MNRLAALTAALLACAAFAAEPAPAAPAAPAAPSATAAAIAAAKPVCEKPEYPGRLADQSKIDRFNKKYKAYGDCMRKFIDEQSAISKAAADAGNNAINEFNAYVKAVNEQAGSN